MCTSTMLIKVKGKKKIWLSVGIIKRRTSNVNNTSFLLGPNLF